MFSRRIKQLREERDLNQKDIAEYLDIISNAYGQYERGKRKPNPDTLLKLADYFDVSVDYILGRTDIPIPPVDYTKQDSINKQTIKDMAKEMDKALEYLKKIRSRLKD